MDELEDLNAGDKPTGSFLSKLAANRAIETVQSDEEVVHDNTTVNLDDKLDYLLQGKSVLNYTNQELNNFHADEQDNFGALMSAIGYVGTQVPFKVAVGMSNMLDAGDYFPDHPLDEMMGGKGEVGNFVGDWINKNISDKLAENVVGGIRTYQGDNLSLTDVNVFEPDWWRNQFGQAQDLTTSAAEYMGAGLGAGALIRTTFGAGKAILGLTQSVRAARIAQGSEALLVNLATNQMSGVQMAADKADELYAKYIGEGKTHDEALTIASNAAANIIALNRATMLMNIKATQMFTMKGAATRGGVEQFKRNSAKDYVLEGLKESGEEIMEGTAEKIGAEKAEDGTRLTGLAALNPSNTLAQIESAIANPWESLESGILGFIGGTGQQVAGDKLHSSKALATSENRFLNKMFGTEVVKLDEKTGNPIPKVNDKGEIIGYETEKVSQDEARERKYQAALVQEKKNAEIFGADVAKSQTDVYANMEQMWALNQEIKKADAAGDTVTADKLRSHVLHEQVYAAADSGTVDSVIASLDDQIKTTYTPEELKLKGINPDYKDRAIKAKAAVLELEQVYLKAQIHPAGKALYDAKASQLFYQRHGREAKDVLTKKKLEFNTLVNESISNGSIKLKTNDSVFPNGEVFNQDVTMLAKGDFTNLFLNDNQYSEQEKDIIDDFLQQAVGLFGEDITYLDDVNSYSNKMVEEETAARKLYTMLTSKEMKKVYEAKRKHNAKKVAEKAVDDATTKNKSKAKAEADHNTTILNSEKESIIAAETVAAMTQEQTLQAGDEEVDEDSDEEVEPEVAKTQTTKTQSKADKDLEREMKRSSNTKPVSNVKSEDKKSTRQTKLSVTDTTKPISTKQERDILNEKGKSPNQKAQEVGDVGNDFVKTLDPTVQKGVEKLNEIFDKWGGSKQNPLERELTPEERDARIQANMALAEELRLWMLNEYAPNSSKYFPDGEPTWLEFGSFIMKVLDNPDHFKKYFRSIKGMYLQGHQKDANEDMAAFYPTLNDINNAIDIDNKSKDLNGEDYSVDTDVAIEKSIRNTSGNIDEEARTGKTGVRATKNAKGEWKVNYGTNIFAYLAIDPEAEDAAALDAKVADLNEGLADKRIMSAKHFKVGTSITLEVQDNVDSVTITNPINGEETTFGEFKVGLQKLLDSKSISEKTRQEFINENTPIAIKAKGQLIGHLHAVGWINKENVNAPEDSLKKQRNELRDIRRNIITASNNQKEVKTTIQSKSKGITLRIKNANNEYVDVRTSEALPDSTLKFDIYNGVEGFKCGTKLEDTLGDPNNMIPGATYVMLPMADGTIMPVPLYNGKMTEAVADTIVSVLRAYVTQKDNKSKTLLEDINNHESIGGKFTIQSPAGLEAFLRQYLYFIPNYKLENTTMAKYMDSLPQGKLGFYFKDGALHIAQSEDIHWTRPDGNEDRIKILSHKGDYTAAELEMFFNELKEALLNSAYTNINANMVTEHANSPVAIIGVKDGQVVDLNEGRTYNEWIKDNTTSTFTGINISDDPDSPEYIYTVQSVISFDTKGLVTEDKAIVVKDKEVVPEKSETVVVGETPNPLLNNRNKGLFPDTSEFGVAVGNSTAEAVISDYREINGIGFSEYTNPTNGLIDVYMTGTSDNDYVGYVRVYENGKPTNRFTSKMSNKSGNKADLKTMISGLTDRLPVGHEYTETTSISLEGLKIFNAQLNRGYELLTENRQVVTTNITLNAATKAELAKASGSDAVSALFNNKKVTKEEYKILKQQILELMPSARVLPYNETTGEIEIALPVLKSTKTAKVESTNSKQEVSDAKAKIEHGRTYDLGLTKDWEIIINNTYNVIFDYLNGKIDETSLRNKFYEVRGRNINSTRKDKLEEDLKYYLELINDIPNQVAKVHEKYNIKLAALEPKEDTKSTQPKVSIENMVGDKRNVLSDNDLDKANKDIANMFEMNKGASLSTVKDYLEMMGYNIKPEGITLNDYLLSKGFVEDKPNQLKEERKEFKQEEQTAETLTEQVKQIYITIRELTSQKTAKAHSLDTELKKSKKMTTSKGATIEAIQEWQNKITSLQNEISILESQIFDSNQKAESLKEVLEDVKNTPKEVKQESQEDVDAKAAKKKALADKLRGNKGGSIEDAKLDPKVLSPGEQLAMAKFAEEIIIHELGANRQNQIATDIAYTIVARTHDDSIDDKTLGAGVEEVFKHIQDTKDANDEAISFYTEECEYDEIIDEITKETAEDAVERLRGHNRLLEAALQPDHKEQLTKLAFLKLKTLNGVKVSDAEMQDADSEALSQERDQSNPLSSFQQDSKKTCGAIIRRFLAGLKRQKVDRKTGKITEETNFYGRNAYAPFDETFDTLRAILTGIPNNIEAMARELEHYKYVHGWIQDLLDKLEIEAQDKDSVIINSFVTAMDSAPLEMKFIFWEHDYQTDKYTVRVTSSNATSMTNELINKWTENLYKSPFTFDNSTTGDINMSQETTQELIDSLLGINDIVVDFNKIKDWSELEYFYTDEQREENFRLATFIKDGGSVTLGKATKAFKDKVGNEAFMLGKVALRITIDQEGNVVVERLKNDANPTYNAKVAALKSWFDNIGVVLDIGIWEQLQETGIEVPGGIMTLKKMLDFKSQSLSAEYNPVGNILRWLQEAKTNAHGHPINLSEQDNIFTKPGVRQLAKFQSQYEKRVFSSSFQAGKKQVQSTTNKKYITDRLYDLTHGEELISALNQISFSTRDNCAWLRDITYIAKDEYGIERIKLKNGKEVENFKVSYVSLQAIKQLGDRNDADSSLLDVSPAEHEFFKVAAFTALGQGSEQKNAVRWAEFLYPTAPATKASRMLVKAKVADVSFQDGTVSQATIDMMYQYIFIPEASRITAAQKSGAKTNTAFYDEGKTFFHFLPVLNSDTALWDSTGALKDFNADTVIQRRIKEHIKNYVESAAAAKLAVWQEYGIIGVHKNQTAHGKKKKDEVLTGFKYISDEYIALMQGRIVSTDTDLELAIAMDFEINQMMANINAHQLFIGDPAIFHKDGGEYNSMRTKLAKHLAIQSFMESDNAFAKEIGNYNSKYTKWTKEKESPIGKFENDLNKDERQELLDTAKEIVSKMSNTEVISKLAAIELDTTIESVNKVVTTTWDTIGKRLAGDVAPGQELSNTEGERFNYLFLADVKAKSIQAAYYERLKVLGFDSYLKANIADAQEYTTWQEHLHILHKSGKISEAQKAEWSRKIINNIPLNDSELEYVLQPIKPVYMNNTVDIHANFDRRLYIKTSSFPLIPQLTEGLEIDKLRKLMENPKYNIQRAVYSSGVKIGAPIKPHLYTLWNKDGTMVEDNEEALSKAIRNVTRKGFRIQMDVPYKESKNKVNTGSQERMLMFANLKGKKGRDGEVITFGNKSVERLEQDYNDIWGDLFKSQFDAISKKLIKNGKIIEEELQKLLKEEAIERGYPIADLYGLDYKVDKHGKGRFVIPLWANPSSKKFEALMTSIVHNKILKTKFAGGSYVVGSEIGINTPSLKGATRDEYEANTQAFIEEYKGGIAWTKYWQGKLYPGGEYYTNLDSSRRYTTEEYNAMPAEDKKGLKIKVLPTQVLAPSKFRDTFGNLVDMRKFIDLETNMIDMTKVPKELMEAFQFRIPTQGHMSMSWVEVVGFIPPDHGDLLIIPKDLTVQKGLDFDVDKEYQYHFEMEMSVDDSSIEYLMLVDDLNKMRERATSEKEEAAKLKALKEHIANTPYVDKDFASEEAKTMIKEGLTPEEIVVYEAMSLSEIKSLNGRPKTGRIEGNLLTPIAEFYSKDKVQTMFNIKARLTVYNVHWRSQMIKPREDLKAMYNKFEKENAQVRMANAKLKNHLQSSAKFHKLTDDSHQSLLIPTTEAQQKTGVPKNIKVVVDKYGIIMNRAFLEQMNLMDELSDALDGDVDEAIATLTESKFKDALLRNKLLDIHKQIMLHPEVQAQIFQPLSFGDLKYGANGDGIAKDIDAALKLRKNKDKDKTKYFTPLSSDFQRDKLTSGLAGSIGIGSFSLDSVFCSLCQGKNVKLKETVIVGKKPDGSNKTKPVDLIISFGKDSNEKTAGSLSETTVVGDDSKTRMDVIAAFQSAAVDNENEQILDKINANKHTFDFIRAMTMLGYDENLISVFMSQDIVRKYTDEIFTNESSLNDNRLSEEELIAKVLGQFQGTRYKGESLREYDPSADSIGYDKLLEMINSGEDVSNYAALQVQLLEKFVYITKLGRSLKEVQSITKIASQGVGKSLLGVALKWDKFMTAMGSNQFTNLETLIGDVIEYDPKEMKELQEKGYYIKGKYAILPKTIPGYALRFGLGSANDWFDSVIPVNDIKSAFTKMFSIYTRKEPLEDDYIEMFDELKSYLYTADATKIIGSRTMKKVRQVGGDIQFRTISGLRDWLLRDVKPRRRDTKTQAHDSLASIVSKIQQDTNLGKNNEFLNRLTTKTVMAKDGTKKRKPISMITYNASPAQGLDETAIYAGFLELFTNNIPLGEFNGIAYTSKMLAQDLVAYNFAIGGLQGANNFAKYIPIAYLQQLGFGDSMQNLIDKMGLGYEATSEDKTPEDLKNFMEQYLRHNPDKANFITKSTPNAYIYDYKAKEWVSPDNATELQNAKAIKIYTDDTVEAMSNWKNYSEEEKLRVLNKTRHKDNQISELPLTESQGLEDLKASNMGTYRSVRDNNSPTGYKLFKFNKAKGQYEPVNTLGGHGISEYDYENTASFGDGLYSILPNNNSEIFSGGYRDVSPSSREFQNRFWGKSANADEKLERHGVIISELLTIVDDSAQFNTMKTIMEYVADIYSNDDLVPEIADIDLIVDNNLASKGSYRPQDRMIVLNEFELTRLGNVGRMRTITEEYVHAITDKLLKAKPSKLTKVQLAARERVRKNVDELREHLRSIKDPETGVNAYDKLLENLHNEESGFLTPEQRAFDYAAYDSYEFLAAALLEPEVTNYLAGLERYEKTNFWTNVLKALANFLKELGYDTRNSRLGEVLEDFMILSNTVKDSDVRTDSDEFIDIDEDTQEEINLEEEEEIMIEREYTPKDITVLKPNEIFVFGSNAKGVHGKGGAKDAKEKFGAIQGQAEGLQGQSYAVITKKDWRVEKSSTLQEIGKGLQDMLLFAKANPDKKFLVSKLGSSNAGYTVAEIKNLFERLKAFIPDNVVLPKEYEVRDVTMSADEAINEVQDIIPPTKNANVLQNKVSDTMSSMSSEDRKIMRDMMRKDKKNPLINTECN